jgi:predicted NBD/HSP70 family sugar kinase
MVASLGAVAERLAADAGVTRENVLGLSVNLQAIVDREAGTVFAYPATPGWSSVWDDLPLRDLLERQLPWRPVVVEDTVRALGTAESQLGGRELTEDFVFAIADVGIGASLVMGGPPRGSVAA